MFYTVNIFGEIGVQATAEAIIPQIQFAAQHTEEYEGLLINLVDTPGGSYSQGVAIRGEIKNYKRQTGLPVEGIGSGFVGSISTLILEACDPDRRRLYEMTDFFIHNPFISQASGDADQLREYAADIERKQAEMNQIYQAQTGLSFDEIALMMNEPVILSAEDALNLGFVSDVLRFVEIVNNYSKTMKPNFFATFKDKMGISSKPEALALNLVNGKTAQIQSAGEDPAIGDPVTVEGSPLEDGRFETQSGLILDIQGGKISGMEKKTPEASARIDQNAASIQALTKGQEELQLSMMMLLEVVQGQAKAQGRQYVSSAFQAPGQNVQSNGNQFNTVKKAPEPEYTSVNDKMNQILAKAKAKRKG